MVQISSCFRVDLTKDVGCFRQVELGTIASRDHLRGHTVLKHHLLESLIVVLTLKHANNHGWMTEMLLSHHVLAQLFVQLFSVVFLRELDPMRFFDLQLELS